jgi:hypothetical protein
MHNTEIQFPLSQELDLISSKRKSFNMYLNVIYIIFIASTKYENLVDDVKVNLKLVIE